MPKDVKLPRQPARSKRRSLPSPRARSDKSRDVPSANTLEDKSAGGEGDEKDPPLYKRVLDKLRTLILSGEFDDQRDKHLSEEWIRHKLETNGLIVIGDVPIRRALLELEYERLVKIRPKAGTFIRTIGADELGQLVRTRSVLEEFFVCTCARDTSSAVNSQLDKARGFNNEIRKLAESVGPDSKGKLIFAKVLGLDMAFHDALADGAGYPFLKKEFSSVRYRLRLAHKYVELNAENLLAIANDHQAILDAIRPHHDPNDPGGDDWGGDVIEARLAIKNHLRNAIDRLGIPRKDITDQKGYASDPILDLPTRLGEDNDQQASAFGVLRILLELVVAAELARQKDTYRRLSRPKDILAEMGEIAQECTTKQISETPNKFEKMKARFINCDMQFHSSLAYTSGLLFAQEAVTHVWQRMYDDAERHLDGGKMNDVVNEHQDILRDLTYFSQKRDGDSTKQILKQVKSHFIKAYKRAHPEDEDMETVVTKFLTWFVDKLSTELGA